MKKIDNFVNLYSVSKTLRFKAIPVGKTQDNIESKRLLEEDEDRANKYKKAKKIIDRYHIVFIDRVLQDIKLTGLDEYIDIFVKKEKTDVDKKNKKEHEARLRKQIADAFKKDSEYKKLFDKALIEEVLPSFLTDDEEKEIIKSFVGFKTAFEGFNQNRANMYSEEEKSTAIAYRCINDNLPRFISNMMCFEKISSALESDILDKIKREQDLSPYSVKDLFHSGFYNFVLANGGIALYNSVIGGFVTEDGTKIQGLNEYINLYNQRLSKDDKGKRLPLLKLMYKQVLSDYEGKSYYSDGYANTNEMISDLRDVLSEGRIDTAIEQIETVFKNLTEYELTGIYIKNGVYITDLSKSITGDWSVFRENWNKDYDSQNMHKRPKNYEKYYEKRRKEYNAIEGFAITDITKYLATDEKTYSTEDIVSFYARMVADQTGVIRRSIESVTPILSKEFDTERIDTEDKVKIKACLDSIKELERILKAFLVSGKEGTRDEAFYGELIGVMDSIDKIDSLYNRVRNFVTRKPYSTDKYKLYFQNPQFMGGWDRNKVADYRATLLRKDGMYYIAVIDKTDSSVLQVESIDDDSEECYEKMIYKQIQDAAKYLSSKQINPQNPPSRIKQILIDKKNKTLSREDTVCFISYLINDFLKNYKKLQDDRGNYYFNFRFKKPEEYDSLREFFTDVEKQAYIISFKRIPAKYIEELVDMGKVYLFQIYNKDFSPYSHGTENLHTMLFKQIFDESNNGLIKLCGGAELFFRRASIKKDNRVIHHANQKVKNKNPLNEKKESIFEYDLIKDKRYTIDQYEIHIPITLNRTAAGVTSLNNQVRVQLAQDPNPYIIGIDRGERNLLYICVIDGTGKIVEQFSLNEIINEYKGTKIKTDYHDLLSKKEEERLKARQNWDSIENIKELKEGYISQVIHKICQLVIKYDAVIAMEDLNSGFKNSRVKVEKQVYQKFEKALIDKLNYMSDKKIEIGKNGSVIKGYQLANQFKSFKSMSAQNGIIFYIPAWLTSKIDPVTGFADLLKPKYTSVKDAQYMIRSFECIHYDTASDMFVFSLDYRKFTRTDADYKKKWKIHTNGTRIKTYRNPNKNNEWDNESIVLTSEFKKLFDEYGIRYAGDEDIRESICGINEKQFYVEFIQLIRLTLQMRNSITGRTDSDADYLISPVKNDQGVFYDSRTCADDLPQDADANGAYNIARKVLWTVERFKEADEDEIAEVKIAISNKEWLEFVQRGDE